LVGEVELGSAGSRVQGCPGRGVRASTGAVVKLVLGAFAFELERWSTGLPIMSDLKLAEELNDRGLQLSEGGDIPGAEGAYRAAIEAAPQWHARAYNLGLLCKYEGRWLESLAFNQRASQLASDDEASWWNLGIAATAVGDWPEARRAWKACGMD